jgi:hypothetical protein
MQRIWPRICGLDFGWQHPTAAVWIAWDRDSDTAYVYDCYRVAEKTPAEHYIAIRSRGAHIPIAWPHDGLQHDKGSGLQLAQQYRDQGLNMLEDKATAAPMDGEDEGTGGNSVEAAVMDMLDRMQTGRLKVFSNLNDWFEEFRMYHRKDGKIVKLKDQEVEVELFSGKTIEMKPATFSMLDAEGNVLASATNFPLNLAWACTIHKAQGATLDRVHADLNGVWEHGQSYVALSRVRSSEDLSLSGLSPRSFRLDPEVVGFYRSLRV